MIKTMCLICRVVLYRFPSKIEPRNYCSRECYRKTNSKEIAERGKKFRFQAGGKRPIEWTLRQTEKVSNEKNYAWKGESVGYRGLHQWVKRRKGKPIKCLCCGKESTKPRIIQWANIDGKYRRNLDDFIPLCCSCHKYHDIKIKKSIQGALVATR